MCMIAILTATIDTTTFANMTRFSNPVSPLTSELMTWRF